VPHQFVRLAMSLPARIAIVPMQDVLGAGKGHRMNVPGTVSWNNWAWRFTSVPKKTATRLAHLSEVFERNQNI
jgi:4-alpha-glucanotransferase